MGHRKEQKTEHKEHKMTIKTEANNESIGCGVEKDARNVCGKQGTVFGAENFLTAIHYLGQNLEGVKGEHWAYHHMKESATCGYCNAHIWLARMLRDGSHGAPLSKRQAKEHYGKAIEQGSLVAQKELNAMTKKELTPEHIYISKIHEDMGGYSPQMAFHQARYLMVSQERTEETGGLASVLMKKAADEGFKAAQIQYAIMFRDNLYGCPRDPVRATKYFQMAKKQGSKYAKKQLKILKKGAKK